MNCDLVLCGVGGQGVLSTAYVVDHAAVDAGLHFKQPEVHGMAQRGGAVSAQVRLSDAPVSSDLISDGAAHVVLSVEPMESLRYCQLLAEDGWVVTDVTPMKNIPDYPELSKLYEVLFSLPQVVALDATRLAAKAGVIRAQNMVVLGAASALLPLPTALLEKHIAALFAARGERLVQSNLTAFRFGCSAGVFGAALRARGVPAGRVAQVVARLDFGATPAADEVVKVWADRLLGPEGAAFAARVFASGDLLPLEVTLPAKLS
jgi:indolepyruvate ferredoxin oxidoreductase beta subunit